MEKTKPTADILNAMNFYQQFVPLISISCASNARPLGKHSTRKSAEVELLRIDFDCPQHCSLGLPVMSKMQLQRLVEHVFGPGPGMAGQSSVPRNHASVLARSILLVSHSMPG
eukprot:574909-Amphidinium_carterae.2